MKQTLVPPLNLDLSPANSSYNTQNRHQVAMLCLRRLVSVFLLVLGAFVVSFFWLLGHPLIIRAAGPHYVAITGVDSANCSISNPCRTIQQAITNAANGDEIRVAAGLYPERINLNKNLTLRGGFTTTNWFTPDPNQNRAIIDAQNLGRVIIVPSGVIATVTGFDLTGGTVTGIGGGVYNQGTLILADNRIYGNNASEGGGVANEAILTLSRSQIFSNTTTNIGGGLRIKSGTALVEATKIFSNVAQFDGGGIHIDNGALTVRSSVIYSNSARLFGLGGGVHVENGNVKLENNTIFGNYAADRGGGVFAYTGTVNITNSLIISNTAGFGGGGIFSGTIASGLSIAFTDFFGNSSNHVEDTNGIVNPTTIGTNNRINDPQFVNPQNFNFHLPSFGSPALDSGTLATTAHIDFDGEGRPFGVGMDRGADESTDRSSSCYARIAQTGQVYTTAQTAVDNAATGSTVQVAGRCVSSAGQQQTLLLSKNMTLHGGYTVTDWLNASYGPTLLDANLQGRVIAVTGSAAVTLDSLYITGGLVSGDGAGVYLDSSGQAILQNNVIYGNWASDTGGGVYNSGRGSAILQHNTIYNNRADSQGGGVYASGSGTVSLRNSIIANNQGYGIASAGNQFNLDYNDFSDNLPDHKNGPSIYGSHDLVGVSPAFQNPAAVPPNLHLQYTSALIEAADPASSLGTDFDNDTRPQGKRSDIGADESAVYPGVALSDAPGKVVTDVVSIRGTSFTFHHTITNLSNNPSQNDTFDLDIVNNNGWPVTLVGISSPVVLSAGSSLSFDVVVTVPLTVTGGVDNQTMITATSQTNSGIYDMAVDVISSPGAQLVPNYDQSAKPGEILTYTHILTNIGPVTDTFNLSFNSSRGWGQLVGSGTSVTLPAGGSTLITVSVQVTNTAPANLFDVSTLVATSANYGVSATGVDTTTAKATVGDRYVAPDGRDTDNNCTQSALPCATIKHAVGQTAFKDTVKVAGGVYPEAGININQYINLRGGFSRGNWTTPDPIGNLTIVDAQNSGRALLIDVTPVFQPLVDGFTIRNGTGDGGVGGAIYVKGTSAPTLTKLIILDSAATRGGGIYLETGNAVLQEITISNTTASQQGGAIYQQGGNVMASLLVISNTAAGSQGGGVYQAGGTLTISQTRLSGSGAANGGGFYSAGGTSNLWNNFIFNNTAMTGAGGGVYKGIGALNLINNSLFGNRATTSGGGISAVGSSGIVSNTIVVSNTATTGGGIYRNGGSLTANYNDVWGNTGGDYSGLAAGSNDISANPLFEDVANGNLRLIFTSPAVDKGDPNTALKVDFENDRRPANQGFDLGADELQGCLAKIEGGATYDILQQAVDLAPDGGAVLISGICRGAKARLVNGQLLTQTVIITQNLSLKGGYNSSFSNNPDLNPELTILDALYQGRTLVITNSVAVTLSHLTLTGGDAAVGGNNQGGGIYNGGTQLKIETSVITGNRAAAGGGIYNLGGTLILGDENVAKSTQVISNTAGDGGGLYVQAGSAVLTHTTFANNTATNGGGVYNSGGLVTGQSLRANNNSATAGGAFYNASGGGLTLMNALVFSNTASNDGGGLYNISETLAVRHDTFYANSAGNQGGGIYHNGSSSTPLVNSTILVDNTASAGSAIYSAGNPPTFRYNNLFNNSASFSPDGSNLSANPNFLSTSATDLTFLHLPGGSPVEDKGDPASPVNVDFDGDPRPSNQNFDIGADEVGGCYVRVNNNPTTYGNVMVAVGTLGSSSTISDVVKVAGICQGVNLAVDGGQPISQTVFLTKSLTIQGGYNKDNWQETPNPLLYPTILDALNYGRVVYITNSAVISISGLQLRQGFANNGGAIFVGSGVLTLTKSFVYSSTATANGGAIYNAGGTVAVDSNDLRSNQAANGGAFFHVAGVSVLQNNIIRQNTATTNGGGIYNATGNNLTVWHNTVYANSATDGGGFYNNSGNPRVVNTIFAANIATGVGHAMFSAVAYPSRFNDAYPATNAYNVNISPVNSLSVDPLFIDALVGDFHLQKDSLVIDRGDPAMTLSYDFEGDLRPSDQGFDMGADEQASCRARIARTGQIYGTVQRAVDNSLPGDTIQISIGTCLGVHQYVDGGNVYSQTVHIIHDLTLAGRYALDFSGVVEDARAEAFASTATTFNAMNLGRTIFVTNSAAITLTRINLHTGNANLGGGSSGGALYFNGPRAKIEKSGFYSNTATYGGAIFNATGVITLTGDATADNKFTQNSATRGGGIYNDSGVVWLMNNSLPGDDSFFQNQANQGGFAYNNNGQMILENNKLSNNQADEGGALYNNTGILKLDRGNRLLKNEAANSGGAIYNKSGSLTVWNALIYGNTNTNQGAGIYSAGGNPQIIHNDFYQNGAIDQGGGIYIAGGNATIKANIFDRNTAPNGGSAVYAASGSLSYNDYWTDNASLQVAGGVSSGSNNFNVNPNFVGAGVSSNANFQLMPFSQLIDAGPSPDFGIPHDFEDEIRPSNTYPDIGADEYNDCLAKLASNNQIYGTIQAAVNAASSSSSDTIYVAEGVCEENVNILNKNLTISGSWTKDFANEYPEPSISTIIKAPASSSNSVMAVAGSVSSFDLSQIELTNGNSSNGGGLYLGNGVSGIDLSWIDVAHNQAGYGGGIYIGSNAIALLSNVSVDYNYATAASGSGGGIYVGSNSNVTIVDGGISYNEALNGNGGGLYNGTGSQVNISGGSSVSHNVARYGGGVYNNSAAFILAQKQINFNQATSGEGGGIYATNSAMNLVNLGLYGNTATSVGGGLYQMGGNAGLYHATIQSNNGPNGGGGVYNAGGTMAISASIVASNRATTGATGVQGPADIAYTLRWNNEYNGVSEGPGNKVGDPLFKPLQIVDGELSQYSPAIDGVPASLSHVTVDRVLDPRDDPLLRICDKDMGRDEFIVQRQMLWTGPIPTQAELAPTEAVTYTFSLKNGSRNLSGVAFPPSLDYGEGSGYTETITLTLSSSKGWAEIIGIIGGTNVVSQTGGQTITLELASGQAVTATVQVTVPAGSFASIANDNSTKELTVLNYEIRQCADSSALFGSSSPAVTLVKAGRVFVIAPDNFGAARPGETITYSHIITNLGNITDTYRIVAGANQYAPGQIIYPPDPYFITLAPLQTGTITMAVTIDAAAAGGITGRTNVVGISQGDPALFESALDTTAISYTTGTRHVSLDGSDSLGIASKDNNCTQRDTAPCRTIQQAINQAAPGDLIKIEQGDYNQLDSDILTTTYKSQAITQIAFVDKSVTLQGGYEKDKVGGWDENPPNHISQTTTLDPQGLGRAIFVSEGITATLDRLTLVNGDPAGLGGGPGNEDAGGGIYNDGSNLTVSAVRLASNTARLGGGLYSGAGNLLLQNSLLYENSAANGGNGGGLYISTGTATLQHNTFYNNHAQGNGGAAYINNGSFIVTNTIFATNTGNALYLSASAAPAMAYNLYQGNTNNDYVVNGVPGTPPGTGNLFADPQFVNPASDPPNFNVRSSSPAVDANPVGLSIDYANTPRPQGPGYDIGAYERAAVRGLRFYSDTITSAVAPSTVVVTHTVENIGEVTEVITISAASTQPWVADFGQPLPYTITLTAGLSRTLVVTYNVPTGVDGQTNTTVITAAGSLPALFDTVTDIINVRSVGWQISKTVTPTPTVQPGDYLTYTLTITNTGDLETQGSYTVTDDLPNDTNFVSAGAGGILFGSTVQWVTDTTVLSNNGSLSFSYVVTVTKPLTDGTPIINQTYSVNGGGAPAVASGPPVTVTVTAPAILTISKTATPDPIQPGDYLTYTLTLTNDAQALGPALTPVITDVLPGEVVYQAMGFVPPAAGLTSNSGSTLQWDLAEPLQPGASAQVTVTVRLTSPLAANTVLTNTFGATASNIATAVTGLLITPVTATNNILLQKTVVPTETGPGGDVTYTITLSNTGNGVAAVSLTDILAPGFTPAAYNTRVVVPGRTWSTSEGSASVSFVATAPITPGIYSNTLVTADYDLTSTLLSDTAPVTVETPFAALTLSKTPDLQMVQSGGTAIFTLTVTNTGNVALVPVIVGDPEVADCDGWTVSNLAVGASANHTCTQSNVTASFTNTAVATGTAALGGQVVTGTGIAVVQVINPALAISKTPDSQLAQSGDAVTFTITVTNTGDITLANVAVTDLFAPDCNQSLGDMSAGASSSYTCTMTTTSDLTNTAVVIGAPPAGPNVTASDDAFVNVVSPALQISKTSDVQFALSGDIVTFTISVTNTGDISLTNIIVNDDQAPDCDDRNLGTLDVGVSSSFTCTRIVTVDLTNTATVTGTPPLGPDISASDDAFVDVISPAIQISKTAIPSTIQRGDPVTFTITITNTGDAPLANIEVGDEQTSACVQSSLGSLAGGASLTYTCSQANVTTSFTNTAVVTGTPPIGPVITDTAEAPVQVVGPNLEISKLPAYQDIVSGTPVTFTIIITNSGDITLTTVAIEDVLQPACSPTYTDMPPGDVQSYDCAVGAVTTDLTNTVIATGTPEAGRPIVVSATAIVNVAQPGLTLAKTPDSQFVLNGDDAVFTITVINTGDVTLDPVSVTDTQAPLCNNNNPIPLFRGFTWVYTCTLSGVTADFTNTAVVTGATPISTEVIASDDAFVDVVTPAITLTKTPDSQMILNGGSAVFTIIVTNTGDITLTNIQVDDAVVPGCNRPNLGTLAAGAASTYTCTQSGVSAAFTNVAVVTGTSPVGSVVTGTDTAMVTVITPALTLAKTPDFQVASNGDTISFTITVTNTGDVTLAPITITDALSPSCTQVISSGLAAGSSSAYACAMTAGTTDIINTAIATGVSPAGLVVARDTAFVDTTPPARPTLLAPPNLSYTNNPTVTFSWRPTAEAVTYTLNLSGTTYDVPASGSSSTWVGLAEGVYTWTVRSVDAYSRTQGYTDSWRVTVDTTPPAAPILITPANGLTVTNRPLFDWSDVTDALSGPVTYTISLAGIADFVTSTSNFTPLANLPPGVYTWSVRAYDRAGNISAPSAVYTFTIEASRSYVYLPIILNGTSINAWPDLKPIQLTVQPATGLGPKTPVILSVVIQNVGTAPAPANFWVDFYINPPAFPTEAGHVWSALCPSCYGLAWQVRKPLAPGEMITLTSAPGDPYLFPAYTRWPGYFNQSGPQRLGVYVDSWDGLNKPQGFILEGNETNNLITRVDVVVTGTAANNLDPNPLEPIPARPLPGR